MFGKWIMSGNLSPTEDASAYTKSSPEVQPMYATLTNSKQYSCRPGSQPALEITRVISACKQTRIKIDPLHLTSPD